MSEQQKNKDPISGVETTGHEWDGIQELNNPAPRWWLLVWLLCTIWAIGYWVIYPAWPTLSGEGERGGTVGSMEWTQYKELTESQIEIQARKAVYADKFDQADYAEILSDPALYKFAIAGGKSAFKDNCATCHGSGGAGAPGYPNLNDDDWIWGGTTAAIESTIQFGIRSDHDDTRIAQMPAFKGMLSTTEVANIAKFVVNGDAAGNELFQNNCSSCHGTSGQGIQEMGGPNLKDPIWLYAGSIHDIKAQILAPKHGMMPAWTDRLPEQTIRQLTIYVHSLGGGK